MSDTKFSLDFIQEQLELMSDREVCVAKYTGDKLENVKAFSDQCLDFNQGTDLWFLAATDPNDDEGIGTFIALTGNAPASQANAERLYWMWKMYPEALKEIVRLRELLQNRGPDEKAVRDEDQKEA